MWENAALTVGISSGVSAAAGPAKARRALVDTAALTAEVRAGRLQAALDVTDPEPLPPDHPLWSLPGVLISPHTGGLSTAFEPRARRLVAEQLRRWRAGQPLDNLMTRP